MACTVMCVLKGLAVTLQFPSSACSVNMNRRKLKFSEEVTGDFNDFKMQSLLSHK